MLLYFFSSRKVSRELSTTSNMRQNRSIYLIGLYLIVMFTMQIGVANSRPFFHSNFYLDDSSMHDRSIPNHSQDNDDENQFAEFKFVTIGDGGKTDVVNTIYQPVSHSRTYFHDFFVMPVLEERTAARNNAKLAVFKRNSNRGYRKRNRFGMMGLWG